MELVNSLLPVQGTVLFVNYVVILVIKPMDLFRKDNDKQVSAQHSEYNDTLIVDKNN